MSRFVAYAGDGKIRHPSRTGPERTEPTLKSNTATQPDVTDPSPDEPAPLAEFAIDNVKITPAK